MKKTLRAVAALLLLAILAVGIALATFDVNAHCDEIENALSKQTGRTVKFGGALHLGLSLKGLTLSIRNVSVGNPSWASRPNMASIDLFNLELGLLPLLSHHVDVKGLSIENADLLLESATNDRHNWVVDIGSGKNALPPPPPITTSMAQPIAINVTTLSIKKSRITVRSDDGKLTNFLADDVTVGREGSGLGVHFAGDLNGLPIKLALYTSADALTSQAERPMTLNLTVANYNITASGKLDLGDSKAELDSYTAASGDTKIAGRLAASWGGVRPVLQGTLTSDKLVPSDLALQFPSNADAAAQAKGGAAPSVGPHRMFSDKPLSFATLKGVDANLDIAIAQLPAGGVELENVQGKLVLSNGHLLLLPVAMNLGAGNIRGQVNLDASGSPARVGTTLKIADVDLADIIKFWGAQAFLSGKVNADLNLASTGNSLHELASNLNGPINMLGAGGDVISTASSKIAAGITEILSPAGSKHDGMNCLITRMIAQNGMLRSNGILIDTGAATAAGYGDIDLRSETINLDFHAKTKLVDIGGLVPPLHIGGTLSKPDVSVNPAAVVQNVGQMLLGGGAVDDVPDVVTEQGQNSCAYALDHPSSSRASPSAKGGIVQDLAGKAGSLIKGLFGK